MLHEHDIAQVSLTGDLNVRSTPALRRTLDDLVKGGCKRIVLNMAEVPYMDSAGMGLILHTLRSIRDIGGLLSLTNVSKDVLRALRIARLVDLLPVSEAGCRRDVSEIDPAALPLWRTTLPVDGKDLHAARVRIEELAGGLGLTRDALFDLVLAAGEALGNACDHTSGEGILATVSAYADRIVVEVADCGCGYEMREERDLKCGDCAERGRGIALMKLLVDVVSIHARPAGVGTVVHLEKLVDTGQVADARG